MRASILGAALSVTRRYFAEPTPDPTIEVIEYPTQETDRLSVQVLYGSIAVTTVVMVVDIFYLAFL